MTRTPHSRNEKLLSTNRISSVTTIPRVFGNPACPRDCHESGTATEIVGIVYVRIAPNGAKQNRVYGPLFLAGCARTQSRVLVQGALDQSANWEDCPEQGQPDARLERLPLGLHPDGLGQRQSTSLPGNRLGQCNRSDRWRRACWAPCVRRRQGPVVNNTRTMKDLVPEGLGAHIEAGKAALPSDPRLVLSPSSRVSTVRCSGGS